jgi:diaminohydroxyphosphoribosylaminopyrimidine deaminase/5-amino-6-(5-phosphoribosylamino)uracil reductase
MRVALALAQAQLGRTTPNPAVGCLIVKDRKIAGRGVTAAGGRPHAETRALADAGTRALGATAYVTLEPCAHGGQTAPCARALIEAGVRRAVIGCVDPYPAVRGRGIAMLKAAGIETAVGIAENECRRLNEGFITRVTKKRPFATLKLAMTLDGRIATASGDSKWISSPESRELVHRWRAQSDAVMVGARTVITDDPRLNCRIKGGRDPIRVIIDGKLRTSNAAKVYHLRSSAKTILVTSSTNLARARRTYESPRVEVIAAGDQPSVSMKALMAMFARRGWSRVLIEGGANLAATVLEAKVVDRVALFVAPKIVGGGVSAVEGLRIGSMKRAIAVKNLRARRLETDWLLEGDL